MSSTLFTPYKLGPVTLRNRTIRLAAFESMGKDWSTRQLKDYHVAVARGGVGMTTLAYAAVCRSGLSFNKQLWLRPEIVPGLREITDAVHREGAAAAIQIGHCGNMTHWTTAGQMPIGASTGFNLYARYHYPRGHEETRDRTGGPRLRHGGAHGPRRRIRLGGGARRARLPHFAVPVALHQPPARRIRRLARKPHALTRACGFARPWEAARACGMAITVKHNMYDGQRIEILARALEIAKVMGIVWVDGIVLSG